MKNTINKSGLNLSDEYYKLVLNGTKTSTIRLGSLKIFEDVITLYFENKPSIRVLITNIDSSKRLIDLTEKDANKDGFTSLLGLRKALVGFYPNIENDSILTIAHFEMVMVC